MSTPEALLDTDAAAAYLALSASTMRNARWRGEGPPFVRIGRAIRYRRADLDRFIEERIRRSTSDDGSTASNSLPSAA